MAMKLKVKVDGQKRHVLAVESFTDASAQYRKIVRDNDAGMDDIDFGAVYACGKKIATISYNGRIWGLDGKEII
jgi:hypothetical protein